MWCLSTFSIAVRKDPSAASAADAAAAVLASRIWEREFLRVESAGPSLQLLSEFVELACPRISPLCAHTPQCDRQVVLAEWAGSCDEFRSRVDLHDFDVNGFLSHSIGSTFLQNKLGHLSSSAHRKGLHDFDVLVLNLWARNVDGVVLDVFGNSFLRNKLDRLNSFGPTGPSVRLPVCLSDSV